MKPLLAFALVAMAVHAEDFTLRDGTQFKGVKLVRAASDGLVVETDSGVATLKFKDLPVAVQKQYGWVDPAIIAAARAKAAAEQQRLAALEAAKVEAAEKAERKKQFEAAHDYNTEDGDVVVAKSSNGWTVRRLPRGVSHRQSIGGG